MNKQLLAYFNSQDYHSDLQATHQIWKRSGILGTAGIFMFLSYLTIPLLTAVHPPNGSSRVSSMQMGLESEREKLFLLRLLGLNQEDGWMEGIKNPRVYSMVMQLASNHRRFTGMQQDYLNYFGGIIAISVVRVYSAQGLDIQKETLVRYWSYIQHAFSLLDITLTSPTTVEYSCERFIRQHTHIDKIGRILFETLLNVYPEYVYKALPVLFSPTKTAVVSILEERHVQFS